MSEETSPLGVGSSSTTTEKTNGAGAEEEGLLSAPDGQSPQPQEKSLGVLGLISIVFFLVCGGSYGTEDLGGAIAPLWAILGIILVPWLFSLPIALMTAEMATAMPTQGGFIVWIRTGWGEFLSILDAILMVVVVIMDQALYPLIYQGYIDSLFTEPLSYFERYGFCIAFIVLGCVINLFGVGAVGQGSKVFSLVTLLPFLLFVILGWACGHFEASRWGQTERMDLLPNDFALYFSVLVWANCGYEYSGFFACPSISLFLLLGGLTFSTAEVEQPTKNYPRAMVGSVAIGMMTYLLPVTVAIAVAPWETDSEGGSYVHTIQEGSYPYLADTLGFGSWLRYALTIGALASNFGTYTAYLSTSSSALHAMAKEGKVPQFLGLELPRFKTPVVCILFYTMTTCMLVLVDFSVIVELESVFYCVHVLILFSAFARLRFVAPNMPRPYKVPGNKVIAIIIAILPCGVAIFNIAVADWQTTVIAAAAIAGLSGIYWLVKLILYCRKKRKNQQPLLGNPSAEEPEAPVKDGDTYF